MANTTVEAIIKARDEATPVFEAILAKAKAATANSQVQSAATSAQAIAQTRKLQTEMAGIAKAMETTMGAFATAGIRAALSVGGEIEKQVARMRAYTDATQAQISKLRTLADTEGAALPGGPKAYMTSARAAAMSGVPTRAASVMAPYGMMFAYETGDDPAHGMEKFAAHLSMLGHLRDEYGKLIDFQHASNEQIDKAAKETLNFLIGVNKVAPGNMEQVYAGFKFGGPANVGFNRPASELAAFYIETAKRGIQGDEAGVAYRGAMGSLASPTAKARQAIAAGGLNLGDYQSVDYAKLSAENVIAGLKQRIGPNSADKARAHVSAAIKQYGVDKDLAKLNDGIVSAFISTGAKTLHDRTKASNMARDILAGLVTSIDLPRFLADTQSRGLGVGFLNQVFGSKIGSRIAVIDAGNLIETIERMNRETHSDNADRAKREYRDSYQGSTDYAKQAYQGALDSIFKAVEPQLSAIARTVGDIASIVPKMPEEMREWFAHMSAAASALGAVRGIEMVARLASYAATLAGAAEGAVGPLARIVGFLGKIPGLTPVGTAITTFDVMKNVLPTIARIGEVAGGKYWTPGDIEDHQYLEGQAADLRRRIAEARSKAFDKNAFDPVVDAMERQLADIVNRINSFGAKLLSDMKIGGSFLDGTHQVGFGKNGAPIYSMPRGFKGNDGRYEPGFSSDPAPLPSQYHIGDVPNIRPNGITGSEVKKVESTVHGDVSGTAEIHQSTTLAVEPSPFFLGLVKKMESATTLILSGKLGQTESGSNAAKASTPAFNGVP